MSSSRRGASRVAVVFGLLAVLAIPVDVLLAENLKGVRLLQSLYIAVPVAGVLALIALAAARRARFVRARSVYAEGGRWRSRSAWAGGSSALRGGIAKPRYGGSPAAG